MVDPVVQRLVGVYDADGTIRGELAYWIGARLGQAHCSLCDITHGTLRERPSWKECRSSLPVAFEVFHRDDQPDQVRAVLAGSYPGVLAETSDGWVLLLGPEQIEACDSSPDALIAAVNAVVEQKSLNWA